LNHFDGPPVPQKPVITACLIVIGNEILSGRTRDANLQFLATRLNDLGVRLAEARVIPDDEAVIIDTVNACRASFDYVFTTGGIGPTHDDITSACMAKAFGVALERNPDAEALLLSHYKPEDVNDARLTMADIPAGATLIDNPVSRAPGYQLDNVIVLPGVPRIMQAMFEGMKERITGGATVHSTALTAFITEGSLAAPLADIQSAHPETEIGSYPFVRDGRLGVSAVVRSADTDEMAAAADKVRAAMRALGGDPTDVG